MNFIILTVIDTFVSCRIFLRINSHTMKKRRVPTTFRPAEIPMNKTDATEKKWDHRFTKCMCIQWNSWIISWMKSVYKTTEL